ncbi:MAG: sulfatase [Opitutaceae bacterium]|nr:sulfatase [Opitutaceae bacterium]
MRAYLLLPLACLVFAGGASAAPSGPARLNVLHIISDDLNADLSSYGAVKVRTPNLDRLAARAMQFNGAYCNYPVCNASRTSFLSGRRPDTTRIVDNFTPTRTHLEDAVFLPEYFRRQGYRTLKVGKIYHEEPEWEDPRSWDVDIRQPVWAKRASPDQVIRRQGPSGIVIRTPDEDTWDGQVARRAVEFLEDSSRSGTPFFVAAGFRSPHLPYIAPEKYYALYDPAGFAPRAGPPEHLADIPAMALTYLIKERSFPRFPTERPGDTIAAYYAAISYMDAQVGVILDALDRLQLWDRTVVIFHSDHGYHLGEHGGLWAKMSLFEESARVPLLVAAPGRPAGSTRGLVELVDLYPTLADLCNLPAPGELEGTSFRPLLEQPNRAWKQAVFTVVNRRFPPGEYDPAAVGRSVFDGRWRYTEWPDGSTELYDHDSDPYEYANLARQPARQQQVEHMRSVLHAGWQAALPARREYK